MRSALVAALALAFSGVPAHAQGDTPQSLYEAGVQARLAGDNGRAVELLRRVVAAEPANADAYLQLGLSLSNAGRLDEADTALRRALEIAPDYTDARLGLARVEQRRGNRAAALAHLGPVDPANGEAGALRRQIEGMEISYPWRIDVDGGYAFLTGGQPDWKEGALHISHQATQATAVSLGIERSRRFGLTDAYGEMRVVHRLADNQGSGYLLAGMTPDADFRPEWQLGVGGEVRLSGGPAATLFTLDARQARYTVGTIRTLNPGIDQYLAGGRAWIGVRWINIFDENGEHRSGWLGRGDLLATDRLRLFAGAADAPDVSEGRVIGTFSLFGGLSYDVTRQMTIRASLAHDDRETGSDRLQLGLGAGWKF